MAHDLPDAVSLDTGTASSTPGPEQTDWTTAPLRDLITHLVVAHHDYFRTAIPRLQTLMNAVVEKHGHTDGVLRPLAKVFDNLRADLLVHMDKEESLLFPVIKRYEQALEKGMPLTGSPFANFGGPVNVIEHEHESVGAAVRLIRDFTQSYEAAASESELYRALIEGLRDFESRLEQHSDLENNVLFARAAALNPRRQKSLKVR